MDLINLVEDISKKYNIQAVAQIWLVDSSQISFLLAFIFSRQGLTMHFRLAFEITL